MRAKNCTNPSERQLERKVRKARNQRKRFLPRLARIELTTSGLDIYQRFKQLSYEANRVLGQFSFYRELGLVIRGGSRGREQGEGAGGAGGGGARGGPPPPPPRDDLRVF